MAKLGLTTKRLQLDKANATITIVIAVATFVIISSIMLTRTLSAKRTFQTKVITAKTAAKKQLQENKNAVNNLKQAYASFVEQSTNAIGGSSKGTGDRDGDNAEITLDALPSKYDFPALTSSIEKLLVDKNFKIKTISGSDDEVAQSGTVSPNPAPIEMPIEFSVLGGYEPFVDLLKTLEKSIRPIHFNSITLTASQAEMTLDIKAKTYYLPEKALNIRYEAVK